MEMAMAGRYSILSLSLSNPMNPEENIRDIFLAEKRHPCIKLNSLKCRLFSYYECCSKSCHRLYAIPEIFLLGKTNMQSLSDGKDFLFLPFFLTFFGAPVSQTMFCASISVTQLQQQLEIMEYL
jgi:hypothetical protein